LIFGFFLLEVVLLLLSFDDVVDGDVDGFCCEEVIIVLFSRIVMNLICSVNSGFCFSVIVEDQGCFPRLARSVGNCHMYFNA